MKLFSKKFGYFELLVAIILTLIFGFMTLKMDTDIQLHAKFIIEYTNGTIPFQVNFLYYFTVYFLSFFSNEMSVLLLVSIYVLTGITFLKYRIVKNFLQSEIPNNMKNAAATTSIISLLLLFCFSLPSVLYFNNDFYYLLSYPPNIWHNSTTIFVMPFVILLFWESMKQLESHSQKRLFIIGLLICANAVIKPSFLFVYLLIFPLFLLKKFGFSQRFFINLIPIFLSLILVAAEYYFIFGSEKTNESSVTFNFFYLINTWAANGNTMYIVEILSTSIIGSFLFPIVTIIKNKSIIRETKVQFAVVGTILAIIIATTITETGARASHGNFLWQCYMLSFLLFLVCTLQLLKLIIVHPLKWKAYKLEIGVFLLHVISGLYYFTKIIQTSSYL